MSHKNNGSTALTCPDCTIGPFSRNHYFNGKLLVERDFTDEQRYYIEKLRHHHVRLHGWGVVCGLKVVQHPDPACRPRFVCVEPGTAIDCCGHEIVVRERDCFDFSQTPEVKRLRDAQDQGAHTLQICISYRECPNEDIPVLYDECGCDDVRCAPNRITESYELGLKLDPAPAEPCRCAPAQRWENTVGVAQAQLIALHSETQRLYVVAGVPSDRLYWIDTTNHTIATSFTLASPARALAVAPDGAHLYLVIEPALGDQQLLIYDTAQPATAPVQTGIPGSEGRVVHLAVTGNGTFPLLALLEGPGQVLSWGPDVDTAAQPQAPRVTTLNPNTAAESLAIGSGGNVAYVATPATNDFRTVDIAAATQAAIALAGVSPNLVAVAPSSGPDLLLVGSQNSTQLTVVGVQPGAPIWTVPLAHQPIGFAVSPGAQWIYVLERDAGALSSYLQAVNLHQLRQGLPTTPEAPVPVGEGSTDLALTDSGEHLYVAYSGDPNDSTSGGVAILTIAEDDCAGILWRHLKGCPSCETANCVVLATIESYHVGYSVGDASDPPSDPIADAQAHIARINNRLGRRLLPSTSMLEELIECLMKQGPGAPGKQGPPGADGHDGQAGPTGPQGPAGPGLEAGLTQIRALSWVHNQPSSLIPIFDQNQNQIGVGVAIAFTRPVQVDIIDAEHVFQLLALIPAAQTQRTGFLCRCPVMGTVVPVRVMPPTGTYIASATMLQAPPLPSPTFAEAIAFMVDRESVIGKQILGYESGDLWVQLRCDFVLDRPQMVGSQRLSRAVDGEYVRIELSGDRPSGSPYGIQGGLFESWFRPDRKPPTGPVLVNHVSHEVLEGLAGIGRRTAERIVAARTERPFSSVEDLQRRIPGLGARVIEDLRDRLRFD
jgi:DNA-binding beta-propeller fold protein YncE